MTKRTTFLTRCLALVLALVLAASNVTPGLALRAFASEGIKDTELIAKNYALTEAEAALLGYLKSESYTCAPLNKEGLVTVEEGIVTAKQDGDWTPVSAKLVVGDSSTDIALTNGVGQFTTDELAYSVVVTYELRKTVSAETQNKLLNAHAVLQQGIDNMKAGYATDTNLGVVEEALPVLKQLTGDAAIVEMCAITDATIAAVNALGAQIDTLQSMNAAASASKLQYAVENGAAYKEAAAAAYANLNEISSSKLLTNPNVDSTIAAQDEVDGTNNATLWGAFKECLSTLVGDLNGVVNADWSVLTADLLAEGADYAAVEELVNTITATSSVTIVEELLVQASDVTVVSDNAKTIQVNVILEYVENKEWKDVSETSELVVAKDASLEEIVAALEASGLEAQTIALIESNNGIDYNFDVADRKEGTLSEDNVYTITYSPKKYIVSFSYSEAEEHPYGWELTLPEHTDATKSYDYVVNSEKMAQGATVVITGPTEISRTAGKAYRTDDLYSIIGENSGNAIVKEILESGSLTGNKTIRVRQPDAADSELLTLLDKVLTAPDYDASYNGLSWTPYSIDGVAGLFQNNQAPWEAVEGKVVYRLYLEGNNGNEIIELAKTLKTEAEEQVTALDRMAYGNDGKTYADMGTLNKTQLGGFVGMVAYTDLTPGDNDDTDAKNLELREYFTTMINDIINNNLTGTNLTIYNMMTEYRNGGLRYYYQNAEAVRNEIVTLSDRLNGLVGDAEKEKALEELLKAAGKPEYVEKITSLGTTMAEIKAGLSLPNEAIVMGDNLGKLLTALQKDGEMETESVPVPYMTSNTLTAKDPTTVNVQVLVSVNGEDADVAATKADFRGHTLTADAVAALKKAINDIYVEAVGEAKAPYYNYTFEGDTTLDALIGAAIDSDIVLYCDYTPKSFTVKIDGEANQTITVEDLEVTLPAHTKPGYSYDYVIDGEAEPKRVNLNAVVYTFDVADLATLFAGGSYTITRTENDEEKQKAEAKFPGLSVDNKTYDPVVDANTGGLMGFAMDIVNSGYSYIALNNEAFLYLNAANELEISLQVLINAMLDDADFGSQRLIALGDGTTDTLVTGKIDIGYAADDITMDDFDFALHLSSLPAQMTTVANGLDAIKSYMSFQSNPENGQMDIFLNLPDPVYEVYLSAMLVTGELEKMDVNKIDNAIAFNFLDDYLEQVLENEDITAATYENTLNMMIKEFNDVADKTLTEKQLAAYDKYYQLVRRAVNGPAVELNANAEDYTISMKALAENIDEAIGIIGIDLSSYETYMGMIKELKEGGFITGEAVATLADVDVDYEAALIEADIRRNEDGSVAKKQTIKDVYDFTTDLSGRLGKMQGPAAVILLDDVNSNLTFDHTTILDLNGKTVNGDITANARVFIIDSMQDTVSGAAVTGTVSGNATILAGNYASDVSAFLKDGYYVENGNVLNALFTCEGGNYIINTDYMYSDAVEGYLPAVHYMAAELVVDLALNYYTAASLSIEGNDIYAISFDDLVGILGTDSNKGKAANLIDDLLACFRFDNVDGSSEGGIDGFINMVIADLMDLESISESIKNGTSIGDYSFVTHPWSVEVKHVADGDYITAGIVPNADITHNFSIGLTAKGVDNAKVQAVIDEMALILQDDSYIMVDLHQPVREGQTLVVGGGADAYINLDFSHNTQYNNLMALILAYGNPRLNEEYKLGDSWHLVKNGCIIPMNDVMATTTVGEFINAIMNIVEEKVDLQAIVDKVGVELTDAQMAKLEELYEKFLNGAAKILAKLELDTNPSTPIIELAEDDSFVLDGTIQTHTADAYYRGYGVEVNLEGVKATLKVTLAPKCTSILGDVNFDGKVNTRDSMVLAQYYVKIETADPHLCVSDVNGDGKYNTRDSMLIAQYYVKLIDKFPIE